MKVVLVLLYPLYRMAFAAGQHPSLHEMGTYRFTNWYKQNYERVT